VRVLIAFDGSQHADTALGLARALKWPAGSTLRLVQVVVAPIMTTGSEASALVELDEALKTMLAEASATMRRDGLTVEQELLRGHVVDTLVTHAERWRADLLIAGSRGRGAIASTLLGSVAIGLTEHAPCPVLVARGTRCATVLFAEDGSPAAAAARTTLEWPIFAGAQVEVLSVADVPPLLHSGVAPTMRAEAHRATREIEGELRAEHERYASEAASAIRTSGGKPTSGVRVGDPASEIIAAARASSADLIVMGTRGRSGVQRLLLGSVARKVLHHAECSVLVVRERRDK
jgi:nucleotide-binding universal stress UspA family protein